MSVNCVTSVYGICMCTYYSNQNVHAKSLRVMCYRDLQFEAKSLTTPEYGTGNLIPKEEWTHVGFK